MGSGRVALPSWRVGPFVPSVLFVLHLHQVNPETVSRSLSAAGFRTSHLEQLSREAFAWTSAPSQKIRLGTEIMEDC